MLNRMSEVTCGAVNNKVSVPEAKAGSSGVESRDTALEGAELGDAGVGEADLVSAAPAAFGDVQTLGLVELE